MATRILDSPLRPFWLPNDPRLQRLPWIVGVMTEVFEEQEPPFLQAWYGDRYRDFATDPDWLAQSFLANADKEAQGSRKLARIAEEARDLPFAPSIIAHAEDEARHARMYLAMLKLVFPHAIDGETRHDLLAAFPQRTDASGAACSPSRPIESILDDIVQMNIGEVRTRLHQMLLKPVVMIVCPAKRRSALDELLGRILDDEGRHILYTAEILEEAAANGHAGLIRSLYARRCTDFSEITLKEVGVGQFD